MSISGCQSDNSLIAQATTAAAPLTARVDAVPPHAYFVGSAIFHYLGPAFAVLLFVRVDVLGVAWLRIASAALVFALWRRPWRKFRALDRQGQLLILGLGAVFAAMNACFYVSIDRLPLATVAAIEFIGPIALAAIAARVPRNVAAIVAAAAGVYLLTHVRFVGEPVGVAFAFANAVLFTAYIVLAGIALVMVGVALHRADAGDDAGGDPAGGRDPHRGHDVAFASAGVMLAAPAEGVSTLVCPSSHRTRTRAGSSQRTSSTTPARPGWAARSDSTTIRSPA